MTKCGIFLCLLVQLRQKNEKDERTLTKEELENVNGGIRVKVRVKDGIPRGGKVTSES